MNIRFVIRELGLLMIVLCVCMLAISGWDAWRWAGGNQVERVAMLSLLMSAAVGAVVGLFCWLLGSRSGQDYPGRREALLLVAMSWIFGAAVAGLPYYLWAWLEKDILIDHPFGSFSACYFEAMSGLTTTGATILSDIGSVPKGLLLWRALTHWLGGLGIVMLFVAILPTLGVGGKKLFQFEAPGPKHEGGVRPRIADTARTLWVIYLGLTIAAVLSLRLTGAMGWFDAVCHAFSMVSTGGLSTRDASIGAFDSIAVDIVCIVFMLLAGVNFALFYALLRGKLTNIFRNTELRVYLALKLIVTVIVAIDLLGDPIVSTGGRVIDDAHAGQALQYGAFQTVALHTGTGFVTADYDPWPFLSRVLLVGLMFIGGCAGSTAGGIKVIRFWVALKVMGAELEKMFRPNVVRPLKVGKSVIDSETAASAVIYFLTILVLFGLGAFLIGEFEGRAGEPDFLTAMSASISTLCNVGPGLHGVGPTLNYGWFSPASLTVMSLLMALGRLEVFTILVLFLPRFWRSD
jgi:trk system potassium uptake protein TrkH